MHAQDEVHPITAENFAQSLTQRPRLAGQHVRGTLNEGYLATQAAAERLVALGYSNVRALGGGLKAWRDMGQQLAAL